MAKLCRIFCLLFAFATFSIAFPVEDVIPILRPSPSNPDQESENDAQGQSESEHVAVAPYPASASEDATDFPILKPESSGDNAADNEEYEEYGMERPRPQGSWSDGDEEGADEGPLIPRLRPEGSEVDDQDQAAIVYPGFYRVKRNVEDEIPAEEPEPEEVEESGSDYDYENGDYFVERPLPEGFSDENGSGGYQEGDEDDTVVVYPEEGDERRRRRKRSPDDTYEDIPAPGVDGGQDDTVVVNAASCEDLRKKCYETGDPLVCMTLEENCGDEPNDYVNCVLAAKTGKHSAKCRHLSKD